MSAVRVVLVPRGIDRSSGRARRQRAGRVAALALMLTSASVLAAAPFASAASAPVGLGVADSFAVLAGSGITNAGDTTITGDVGSLPTPSQTGFASVTLIGTNHGGDSVTKEAKSDLAVAYNDALGRTPVTHMAGDLGGSTLAPGVYASASFGVAGTLTLDAEGDTDAEFIFQSRSTVIAESDSRILLLNGADPCRVVWQVGSSATFKTGSRFVGNVLVQASITAQTGATFRGRLLALEGAVTLDANTIAKADCPPPDPPGGTTPAAVGATSTTTRSAPPSISGASVPDPTPSTAAGRTPSTAPVAPSSVAPDRISPTASANWPASTTDGAPRWTLRVPREIASSPLAPPFLAVINSPLDALMVTALALLAAGAAGFIILVARRRHRAAATA